MVSLASPGGPSTSTALSSQTITPSTALVTSPSSALLSLTATSTAAQQAVMQRKIHDAAKLYVEHSRGSISDLDRALAILAGQKPGPEHRQQVPFLGRQITPNPSDPNSLNAVRDRTADTVEVHFPTSTDTDKIVGVHLLAPDGSKVITSAKRAGQNSFVFGGLDELEKAGSLRDYIVLVENQSTGVDIRNKLRVPLIGTSLIPSFLNTVVAKNYHFNLGAALG